MAKRTRLVMFRRRNALEVSATASWMALMMVSLRFRVSLGSQGLSFPQEAQLLTRQDQVHRSQCRCLNQEDKTAATAAPEHKY